jgi:putative intracellular protease/amidase
MNRREFSTSLGAGLAALALANPLAAQQSAPAPPAHGSQVHPGDHFHDAVPTGAPQQIAMLLYPALTAQDLVGPHNFFAVLGNVNVHLVWKNRDLIESDRGLFLKPTATLEDCPRDLDLLFVPGGSSGTVAMMRDPEILQFLADRGARARFVTSVCTGSMILGAAGLLNGYKATSHWAVRDLLPLVGAQPVAARFVEDRNRITGAGVTAGLDFALLLAARMRNDTYAKMLQLINEYDPQPPFHAGNPESAGPEITQHLRLMLDPLHENMRLAANARPWAKPTAS